MNFNKLTAIVGIIGFLHWVGNRGIMQTTLGNTIVYPMIILSILSMIISLFRDKSEYDWYYYISLVLMTLSIVFYILIWMGRYWGGLY